MLEDLGLDPEAEAVYRFMLTHRDLGLVQIAKGLGWPEACVEDALNRLADLMLLRRSREAPSKLAPVHPELGLQALLQRQQAQLLERQQRLAESQAATAQLIADYTAAYRRSISRDAFLLEGMDSIQNRLEQLAQRTRSVCLSFMPGGGQSLESLAASKPLDELMMRRGVKVQTVYLDSVRNHMPTYNYACWLTEHGGEVRTTPTLPLRMVLFDRQTALLPADPENTRMGAVQISFSAVIVALTVLFEQVWENGVVLAGKPPQVEEGDLTSQEAELLRLLARGLTDEAAARRLGVSLRTERRMVASLMQRLGARSRFQAAILATRSQWIPQ
ncbi:MAG TPA: helix-turn-helix transcriptional regulator [Streptosporangiaceae bacterium]